MNDSQAGYCTMVELIFKVNIGDRESDTYISRHGSIRHPSVRIMIDAGNRCTICIIQD